MARFLLYTALGAVVEAVAVERMVAAPTDVSLPTAVFNFAQITAPPNLHELAKRQEAQTVLVGPDNTCGYVSGLLASAYTCNDVKAQCAFLTYANIGAVACCNSATCGFRLDCVDYARLSTSSCGASCQNDMNTVKCSRSATPYCGTATFFNGIKDYYCMTSRYSTAKQMLTTWIGEDDGRSFSQLVLTVTTSAGRSATQDVGLGEGSITVTASAAPGGNNNNNNGNNSDNNNRGGSSTPIGAIVGGVVGGVAILVAVALGLFFLIRHNKKKKQRQNAAAAAAAGGYPQMMQQPGGPNNGPNAPPAAGAAAGAHQSVYNPAYAQQQYPSPTQSPPPQQQQGGFNPQQAPPYYAAAGAGAGDLKPQAYSNVQPPSPATSPGIDNRQSLQPSSPTMTDVSSIHPNHTGSTMGGGYQQYGNNNGNGPNVPSTVHEAGGDAVGAYGPHSNHRGQFHEMQ